MVATENRVWDLPALGSIGASVGLLWLQALAPEKAVAATPAPPPVIHFCSAHCSTWYLTRDAKGYAVTPDQPSLPPTGYGFAIGRFDSVAVQLNRTDPPNAYFPRGLKAVIEGRVAPDQGRLLDGHITWTFGQAGRNDAQVTWGDKLNDIPGSGDPRPVQAAQPPQAAPTPSPAPPPPPPKDELAAHLLAWTSASGSQPVEVLPSRRDEPVIASVPVVLRICELAKNRPMCGRLEWRADHYTAIFENLTVANLFVKQWNSAGIVLERQDLGDSRGSTGEYKGRMLEDGSLAGQASIVSVSNFSDFGRGTFVTSWVASAKDSPTVAHDSCVEGQVNATDKPATAFARSWAAGDIVSAACWAHTLAAQGRVAFQNKYTDYLIDGLGVARNPQEAFRWTSAAVDQGDEAAMQRLERMFADGYGVGKDPKRAEQVTAKLREKALERLGHALAIADANPHNPTAMMRAADLCDRDPESSRSFGARCATAIQTTAALRHNEMLESGKGACRAEASETVHAGYGNPFEKDFVRFNPSVEDACLHDLYQRLQEQYPGLYKARE